MLVFLIPPSQLLSIVPLCFEDLSLTNVKITDIASPILSTSMQTITEMIFLGNSSYQLNPAYPHLCLSNSLEMKNNNLITKINLI
ncbi:hypothetical protein B0I22_2564 [Epilithonimonas xixisoli]|uniref:Uncharacterized protein n=1 Tax=Epilithonimonas xixisoli TaxID=1476462 RepID=A0A4R8I4I2_9FLAO|nr:hypothetical protein B0I22_2564 [Epilithonimonas xixisoli]